MKSQVYSWRLTPDLKQALEAEARAAGVSLAVLLDRIAREHLDRQRPEDGDDADLQRRLHAEAAACFGTVAGGDPGRSRRVRQGVRDRLRANRRRRG